MLTTGVKLGIGAAAAATAIGGGIATWALFGRDEGPSEAQRFASAVATLRASTNGALSYEQASGIAELLGENASSEHAAGIAAVFNAYRGSEAMRPLALQRVEDRLQNEDMIPADWDRELERASAEATAMDAVDTATGRHLTDEQLERVGDAIRNDFGDVIADGSVVGTLIEDLHRSGMDYDRAVGDVRETFLGSLDAVEGIEASAATYPRTVQAIKDTLGSHGSPDVVSEIAIRIEHMYGDNPEFGTPQPSPELGTDAARAYLGFLEGTRDPALALEQTVSMIHSVDPEDWD